MLKRASSRDCRYWTQGRCRGKTGYIISSDTGHRGDVGEKTRYIISSDTGHRGDVGEKTRYVITSDTGHRGDVGEKQDMLSHQTQDTGEV